MVQNDRRSLAQQDPLLPSRENAAGDADLSAFQLGFEEAGARLFRFWIASRTQDCA